jgi:hypothetical protein
MAVAELHSTQVDLSGLMEVLGQHLYSTPMVALRELVQNAHDSCVRRRMEDPGAFAPSITVECDAAAGTIRIIDTGAGLNTFMRELIESRGKRHDTVNSVSVFATARRIDFCNHRLLSPLSPPHVWSTGATPSFATPNFDTTQRVRFRPGTQRVRFRPGTQRVRFRPANCW